MNNRIVYGIVGAAGVAAIAVFAILFMGPSFNRLYIQDNSVPISNTSKPTIQLAISSITITKLDGNTANLDIDFAAHNTGSNTAILQTIDYTAYLGDQKIASGGIGENSVDVIRGQEDFNIIGNGTVMLKDEQIVKKSDLSKGVWNELAGTTPSYLIKGLYTYRDNSDLQAAGAEKDFELIYPSSSNVSVTSTDTSSPKLELKLIQTITLPDVSGRIDHMDIDLMHGRLFIAEIANNSVDIVDLLKGKRINILNNGLDEPQGTIFIPKLNRLVVTNGGDGSVDIFDGNSFNLISKIMLSGDADNIRFDNATKLLFVGYGDGAIEVINATNLAKVSDIQLAGHPESFQIENAGNRIFVNVPSDNSIAVVDKEKQSVSNKWTLTAAANFPMALDEANHRLFVGFRDPTKILVYDTDSGKEITSLNIAKDVDDIFYDSVHKQIYASCGEGFIDSFKQKDADRYETIDTISTVQGARTSLFVPEMNTLYVAVPQRVDHDAEIQVFKLN